VRRPRGFTIVELMVTMAVGGLLTVAVVSMYLTVLGQSPLMKTRNTLSTDLQNALSRINDDVRRSSNVTTYNLVPDANAPTSKTGYTSVPGPSPDTDGRYFWRMGENRLLLNQTPIDASANPIYDNAQHAVGQKNTVVYYVRDNALYRRVIAAPYANNSTVTTACAPAAQGGCIASDTKLLGNLKSSLGAAAFKITYFDRNGNAIPYTSKDENGADVADYSGFPLTRSIGVQIELESAETVSGQKVAFSNSMRMQFRSELNVIPPTVVNPPYVPPTNGLGSPGLMVGPGGLTMNDSRIQGGDMYVKGTVLLGWNAQLGGGSWAWWLGGAPANVNVANVACVGASYPEPCGSSSQPINATATLAKIIGRVCAKDQTNDTNIVSTTGGSGLILGCVPPDVDTPVFNKSSFVNSMSGVALGSAASCNNGSTTLGGNLNYTTDVSIAFFCKATITGNAYITANLTTGTSAELRVAESVGKVRPIIVVNGRITISSTRIVPNSYGTTPYFISFYSADSSCSNSPTCNVITPTKLKETLDNYSSASSPISLWNANASGSSFYAYFGEVDVEFLSSVGAIAGQRVRTGTSATVLMNGGL